MVAEATRIGFREVLLILSAVLKFSQAQKCGPLGYVATDLLKPSYWYFDLNKTECGKFPKPDRYDKLTPPDGNKTSHVCRIYLHICSGMKYQCAGTACLRYLYTDDYVVLLGKEKENPFFEGMSYFGSSFNGDNSLCTNKLQSVQTNIKFICDANKKWNTTVVHDHGGALAPKPLLSFDKKSCKLNLQFNYTGACHRFAPGEQAGKYISAGSVLLILFFPGLALYFLVGMLINRMAGSKGKDVIPHAKFWLELPDLIMDGFVLTMATLTCRKEEGRTNYESV